MVYQKLNNIRNFAEKAATYNKQQFKQQVFDLLIAPLFKNHP